MLFSQILGHFWCSVVPLVPFSSNLSDLKNNTKIKKRKEKKKRGQRTYEGGEGDNHSKACSYDVREQLCAILEGEG